MRINDCRWFRWLEFFFFFLLALGLTACSGNPAIKQATGDSKPGQTLQETDRQAMVLQSAGKIINGGGSTDILKEIAHNKQEIQHLKEELAAMKEVLFEIEIALQELKQGGSSRPFEARQ